MNYFKYFLVALYISLIFSSCFKSCTAVSNPVEKEQVILEYNNLLIYSDLSSRMISGPNDKMVIKQIVDYFVKDCVKPGVKVNDRSSIRFSRVNYLGSNCSSPKIDIEQIDNKDKPKFVNSRSSDGGLSKAIKDFLSDVDCNYSERDKGGLDLLSLIYQEVNSGINIKKPYNRISENGDTTTYNFINHIFIFTDGYLEYSPNSSDEKEFYFGTAEIESVRKFCKENNVSVENAIKNNSKFKIRPLFSKNNKLVNLYVLETTDRGIDIEKGTVRNTGELSDNNILKTVWEIWAKESGFRSFKWNLMTTPGNLPEDFIKNTIIK